MSLFDLAAQPSPPPATAAPAQPAMLFQTDDQRAPVATIPTRARQQPMPAWLVRRFEASGHIDADTGATRRARMARCRHCRRAIVIGLDGDPSRPHGGFMARQVDPEPLTPEGEVLELLAGHRPLTLGWVGDHWEINGRDAWQRTRWPTDRDVVAEHRCGAPPLPHQPSQIPDPPRTTHTEEPPF